MAKSDLQLLGNKAAAREVAAARTRFNEALAARDLSVIADSLSEEAVLVPGDDAQLICGREAQLEAWRSIFQTMPDVSYVRLAQRIEIGDCDTLAAETGRWKGAWSSEGMNIRYNGRYFAKWRLDGLIWRLEAETFVTLRRQSV